jgi:hypothetical protein
MGIQKVKSNPDEVRRNPETRFKSLIQLSDPPLFQHLLIKLYTEGDLTAILMHGEISAQKITMSIDPCRFRRGQGQGE